MIPRIDPPSFASLDAVYWVEIPRWHRPFGCPDCRRSFKVVGALTRHLRVTHPRWHPFLDSLAALRERRYVLARAKRENDWRRKSAEANRTHCRSYYQRHRNEVIARVRAYRDRTREAPSP